METNKYTGGGIRLTLEFDGKKYGVILDRDSDPNDIGEIAAKTVAFRNERKINEAE